jgi:hypothetical protein
MTTPVTPGVPTEGSASGPARRYSFRPIGQTAPATPTQQATAPAATPAQPEQPSERGFLTDIAVSVVGGARDAVQETIDFTHEAGAWLETNIPLGTLGGGNYPEENPLVLPGATESETTVGRVSRGLTQALVGFVGAGKFLKGARVLQGAGKAAAIARPFAAGAIGDAVALDPYEDRLSNLVQSSEMLANPITEYLASDEEDSAAEARFKNAVEGLILGGTAEAVFRAARFMKASRKVAAEQGPEAAAKFAAEHLDEVDEAVEAAAKESGIQLDLFDPAPVKQADDIGMVIQEGRVAEVGEVALANRKAAGAGAKRPKAPVVDDEAVRASMGAVKAGLVDEEAFLENLSPKLFNFDYMDSPESVKAALQHTARVIEDDVLKATKGVQSFDKIAQDGARFLADSLDLGLEETMAIFARKAEGMPQLASRVVAGKRLMQSLARDIDGLSKQVVMDPENAEIGAQFVQRIQQLGDLQVNLKAIQTGAARATAAGRIRTVDSIKGERLNAADILDQLNAVGGVKKAAEVARKMLAAGGDPKALARIARATKWGRALDVHTEYWINSILSGPKTHLINLTSNAVQTATIPTEKLIGGIEYGIRNGDWTVAREAGRHYIGIFAALNDAWRMAGKAFRLEENILDPRHMVYDAPAKAISARNFGLKDGTALGTGVDYLGKVLRIPSRFLLAEDEFFKQINYRATLYSKAFVRGSDLGLKGKQLAVYIEDQVDRAFLETGEGTDAWAKRLAEEATFTRDLEHGIGRTLQKAVAAHPGLRIVMPFIRTPTNILRSVWQRTPGVNRLQRQFMEDLASGNAERVAIAKGRQALGSMMWATATMWALDGRITGAGPADINERQRLMETGWQPYSLRVGDKYINMGRLDPFAMIFGLAADFVEVAGNTSASELDELATGMAVALAHNLANKSYLQGVTRFMNAMTQPDRFMEKWVQGHAGSLVPFSAGLQQVASATPFGDEYMREIRSVFDAVRAKIPGLSKDLPPRRSWVTGEPLAYEDLVMYPDRISPFPITDQSKSAVINEIARLKHGFAPPERNIGNVELSPKQYDRLMELHGKVKVGRYNLMERLEATITKPSYDIERKSVPDAPDEFTSHRLRIVKRVIESYRQAAKNQLIKEDRELRAAIEQDRRAAANTLRGKPPAGVRTLLNLAQ